VWLSSRKRAPSQSANVAVPSQGAGSGSLDRWSTGSCSTMKKFMFAPPALARTTKSSTKDCRQAIRAGAQEASSVMITGMLLPTPARGSRCPMKVRSSVARQALRNPSIQPAVQPRAARRERTPGAMTGRPRRSVRPVGTSCSGTQ